MKDPISDNTTEFIFCSIIVSALICFLFSGIGFLSTIILFINSRYIFCILTVFVCIGFFLVGQLHLWIFHKVHEHWRNLK